MISGPTAVFETILASVLQIPNVDAALAAIYATACEWGVAAGEGSLKETLARAMDRQRTPAGIESVPSETYLEYYSLKQRVNLLLSEIDRRADSRQSAHPATPASVLGLPVTPRQETVWGKELAAFSPEAVLDGFAELLVRFPALYNRAWLDEFARQTGAPLGGKTDADYLGLIAYVRTWDDFSFRGGPETETHRPYPDPEIRPVLSPTKYELVAIREAGHALMYDRILRGRVCDHLFSQPIPAIDRPLLLTEYTYTTVDGRDWGKPTRSLRSLITTSAVLLGGHISAAIRSGQDPATAQSPQRTQAASLLEGYMEEYGGGDASELLRTLYQIAYQQISSYWDKVEIIARKLLLDASIKPERVSRIIDMDNLMK